ncbi:nuclear transport factor 2 family protein [Fulvivirgaceae bacterium PWU37]|uniref:Nuclear transport factor 2 family protein n=1 Tax=Dawidia soli TaxID=2782352 RepID=A0AAP2GJW4_9BACT|nr:nuclear transport factor 2 family protein [Dawidia soli]
MHEAIIRDFYAAFHRKDYAAMQALYHPQATFYDPVFQQLDATEVKAMWQMLLTSSRDLAVEAHTLQASGDRGSCTWEARYTFSKTGRPVHNIVHATFEFRDGRIYRHTDRFGFWRWSRQALGTAGWLLGWSPMLRNKVRQTARRGLDAFLAGKR